MSEAQETVFSHKLETAHILIKCSGGYEKYVIEQLRTITNVKDIQETVGNYDILIKVESESKDLLRKVIVWKINKIQNIYSTTTLMCVKKPMCVILGA